MIQIIDASLVKGNSITVTTSSVTGDYYVPYYQWPWGYQVAAPPTDCGGDIHVFPCPHCAKCKCGAATKGKK